MGIIEDLIFDNGLCGILLNEKGIWIDMEHWESQEIGGSRFMFLENNDKENEYIYYIKEGNYYINTWNVPVFSGEIEDGSPVETFILPHNQGY